MTYLWAKPKEDETAREERERMIAEFKARNPNREFKVPMGASNADFDAANFSRISEKGKRGAKSRWAKAHAAICFPKSKG